MRQLERKGIANNYLERTRSKQLHEEKEKTLVLPEGELDHVWDTEA